MQLVLDASTDGVMVKVKRTLLLLLPPLLLAAAPAVQYSCSMGASVGCW